MRKVVVTADPFDSDAELAGFATNRAGAGALASFVGYCRGESDGVPVEALDLQHYPGFTEREIGAISERVQTKHALDDLLVIHRSGRVLPGQPIVLVAALARHRAEAFAAVEELMDYLKTDAPLWKRERGAGGTRWIEPSADDQRRRARWSEA